MRLLHDYGVNAGKYLDRRLTYGPNAVRFVQGSKVQLFSSIDQVIV